MQGNQTKSNPCESMPEAFLDQLEKIVQVSTTLAFKAVSDPDHGSSWFRKNHSILWDFASHMRRLP